MRQFRNLNTVNLSIIIMVIIIIIIKNNNNDNICESKICDPKIKVDERFNWKFITFLSLLALNMGTKLWLSKLLEAQYYKLASSFVYKYSSHL